MRTVSGPREHPRNALPRPWPITCRAPFPGSVTPPRAPARRIRIAHADLLPGRRASCQDRAVVLRQCPVTTAAAITGQIPGRAQCRACRHMVGVCEYRDSGGRADLREQGSGEQTGSAGFEKERRIHAVQDSQSDPFGTAELRRRVLDAWAASPARFREDANAEEDYALGGYRDRVVVELAQNAADAAARAGVPGRLRLTLRDGTLAAANTGAPLDAAGVAALSTLRASSKREPAPARRLTRRGHRRQVRRRLRRRRRPSATSRRSRR